MPTPFAPEHQALRDSVRRLVDGRLAEHAEAAEAGERPHEDAVKHCADLGLFGLDDILADVAACEELGRVRSGGLVAVLLGMMFAADLGFDAGSGLVAVARGVRLAPGTTGVSGTIPFLPGGLLAGRCVVVDSGVVVSTDDRGWTATAVAAPHALRGAAGAAVTLHDVVADAVDPAPQAIARAEVREAAAAVAGARLSFDDAIAYAQQREAFGRTIGRFQVNRHGLARIATRITAAEALVHDTAWRLAAGDAADPAAARLFAGRTAVAAADLCLQLHGGYGYTTAYDAQRAWRDARALNVEAASLRRRLEQPEGANT